MRKFLLYIFPCLILFPFGIFVLSSYDLSRMVDPPFPSDILYIPGWKNRGVSQDEQIQILKKIFSEQSSFSIFEWDSKGQFDECLRRADQYAQHLADRISALPVEKQRKLILIGHSLGGRMTIRAMALLQKRNIFIQKGIFLGAAIPDDDPDIALAIKASTSPNINIYNREDYTLRHAYGTVGENLNNALGAYGYARPFAYCHLQQFQVTGVHGKNNEKHSRTYMKKLENHYSKYYLDFLISVFREHGNNEYAPPDRATKFFWFRGFWSSRSSRMGYKIDRNLVTNAYRLISPRGDLLNVGSYDSCFQKMTFLSTLDNSTSATRIDAIVVPQDKENPAIKVIDQGWETLDEYLDWRFQRKRRTYRILDPRDYQRANGSKEKMEAAFASVKQQYAR